MVQWVDLSTRVQWGIAWHVASVQHGYRLVARNFNTGVPLPYGPSKLTILASEKSPGLYQYVKQPLGV